MPKKSRSATRPDGSSLLGRSASRLIRPRLVAGLCAVLCSAVLGATLLATTNTAVSAAIVWSSPTQVVANAIYPAVKVRASDGDVGLAVQLTSSSSVGFADSAHNYSIVASFKTAVQANHTNGTFDPAGNFNLVWQDRNTGSNYHSLFVKIAPDGSHGNPIDVTAAVGANNGLFPSVTATSDGRLFLVNEEDNDSIGVMESDDGGTTWGKNTIVGQSTSAARSYTRITVDTSNNPHVIFCTATDVFAADRNSNGQWTTVQIDNLGTPGNRAFWSDIAAAPNGDVFGAWQEDGAGGAGSPAEISVAHWNHSTGKWQPEIQNISQSNSNSLYAFEPGITVDSTGVVWVGWRATNNGNSNGAAYSISTNNGESFASPAYALPLQFTRSEMVSMASGGGKVYLVGQMADSSGAFGAWLSSTSVGSSPPTTTTPVPTTTQGSGPTPTPTPKPNCPTITSQVQALSAFEPAAFVVRWTGTDGTSTNLAYTVQYWDQTASSTPNWQTLVSNVVGPAAILTNAVNGHTYAFRSQASDGCSTETAHSSADALTVIDSTPPTASPGISGYANGSMVVRLNLSYGASDNNGSGVASVQLSNDSGFANYLEIPFTTTLTGISWNLDAPQYGGNSNTGNKTVYIRYKDKVGNVPVTPPYSFTENVTVSPNSLTNLQYEPIGDTSNGTGEFLNFYNPNSADASILLTYVNSDGTTSQAGYAVTALGHLTVNTALDVQTVHSIKIASDNPVYVDSTNYRNGGGVNGANTINTPAAGWVFPQNSTQNGQSIAYTLYNPSGTAANVTVSYVDASGNTLGVSSVNSVPAGQSVRIADVPQNQNFSTVVSVTNQVGVVAGRKITWPSGVFAYSLGYATSGASSWYFSYGSNQIGAGNYISVFNPNAAAVNLSFSVAATDGTSQQSRTFQLAANSGATYPVSQLAGGAFGISGHRVPAFTLVSLAATNSSGGAANVVAEQVQTTRGGDGASVLAGASSLATHWVIPGTANDDPNFPVNQTDLVAIANFNSVTAYVTLNALDDSGNDVCTKCSVIAIAPHSTQLVNLSQVPGMYGQKLVVTVDTPNPNYFWRYFNSSKMQISSTDQYDSNGNYIGSTKLSSPKNAKDLTITGIVVAHIQSYSGDSSLVLGSFDQSSTVAIK